MKLTLDQLYQACHWLAKIGRELERQHDWVIDRLVLEIDKKRKAELGSFQEDYRNEGKE